MKVSIRVKIIALGAILSILVTGFALLFGGVANYNIGHATVDDVAESWLENIDYTFRNDDYGKDILQCAKATRDYILNIYIDDPDNPETFENTTEEKDYFRNKYKWCFNITGLGMYLMSDEEREFRSTYQDLVYLLKDARIATDANRASFIFFDEIRDRMIYAAEDTSYFSIFNEEYTYHHPGSYVTSMIEEEAIKESGDVYALEMDGLITKCIPVGVPLNPDFTIGYIVIDYDYTTIDNQSMRMIQLELITLSITSVALIVMFAVASHLVFTKNIVKLSESSSRFAANLTSDNTLVVEDPNIRSRDEIHDLSESFMSLEKAIIDYVALIKQEAQEKERINAELSIASKIQLEALPPSAFEDKNVSINSFIKSAKEVGGDFYDYFYLDEKRIAVLICDVSGKSVPAALFMMRGKELIKANLVNNHTLEKAVFNANNDLIKNNSENLFITAFVGIIDIAENKITYINAGHEKPYILHDGKVIKIDGESNFVLGGVEDFEYKSESHPFIKGDRIFLFTDGLNESIDDKNEEFGYQRIEESLNSSINEPSVVLIDNMNTALTNYVKGVEAFDDVTMLLVELRSDELHLQYREKDPNVITDACDTFEEKFVFLNQVCKSEVGIILDEMLNNYVSYIEAEQVEIDVDFFIKDSYLTIRFTTNGAAFDPLQKEDKYLEEYSEDMVEGGLGISIVKNLSDTVNYEFVNGKNVFTITKKID